MKCQVQKWLLEERVRLNLTTPEVLEFTAEVAEGGQRRMQTRRKQEVRWGYKHSKVPQPFQLHQWLGTKCAKSLCLWGTFSYKLPQTKSKLHRLLRGWGLLPSKLSSPVSMGFWEMPRTAAKMAFTPKKHSKKARAKEKPEPVEMRKPGELARAVFKARGSTGLMPRDWEKYRQGY